VAQGREYKKEDQDEVFMCLKAKQGGVRAQKNIAEHVDIWKRGGPVRELVTKLPDGPQHRGG